VRWFSCDISERVSTREDEHCLHVVLQSGCARATRGNSEGDG
jgi:hypothetical protein